MARIGWFDISKGIGIILVVLGHVMGGLINANLPINAEVVNPLIKLLYSFHMPLFFVISGFFFVRSAQTKDESFLSSKFRTILYPYLLWSIIQLVIEALLAKFTNKGVHFSDILVNLYHPTTHFWFLHALFIITVLTYFSFKFLHIKGIIFTSCIWLLYMLGIIRIGVLDRALYYILFFNTGILLYYQKDLFIKILTNSLVNIIVLILFILLGYFYMVAPSNSLSTKVVLGFMGSFIICSLSYYWSLKGSVDSIEYLGKNSLYIYILHVLAGSGMRIFLQKVLGVELPLIHIVLGFSFALLAPLVVYYFCKKNNMLWLFTYPKKDTKLKIFPA